jgi:hypothetical protein
MKKKPTLSVEYNYIGGERYDIQVTYMQNPTIIFVRQKSMEDTSHKLHLQMKYIFRIKYYGQ